MTSIPAPIPARARRRRADGQGLGLPELLVGLAVGAIVLAAGVALLERQVGGHRALQQRWQAEREWQAVDRLMQGLLRQARTDLQDGLGVHEAGRRIEWQVAPRADEPLRRLGWRVRGGVLQLRVGDGGWQPQTDPAVLQVLELAFERLPAGDAPCATQRLRWRVVWRPVPVAGAPAAPTQAVREVALRQSPWEGGPCPG